MTGNEKLRFFGLFVVFFFPLKKHTTTLHRQQYCAHAHITYRHHNLLAPVYFNFFYCDFVAL